jgi:hypothetical protein
MMRIQKCGDYWGVQEWFEGVWYWVNPDLYSTEQEAMDSAILEKLPE